ncbi:MAG TPA: hypothetical protein DEP57_06090, partial [Selenomonas sp.]|nr:hypothetical protein [Selenomonas sp.]
CPGEDDGHRYLANGQQTAIGSEEAVLDEFERIFYWGGHDVASFLIVFMVLFFRRLYKPNPVDGIQHMPYNTRSTL